MKIIDHKLDTCGCCEGQDHLTPLNTYNQPGLNQLVYRAGTHASFFETMIADLGREEIKVDVIDDRAESPVSTGIRPLQHLKTRRRDDFSIALLDAWATIADVLTFYQERIANEGYLLTAAERRSIVELARLVGYELRPGVAASTYLAFTVDETEAPVMIPVGTRAQSIPDPGENMQSFETMYDLTARFVYNDINLRQVKPQFLQKPDDPNNLSSRLYLPGHRDDLSQSTHLLLVFGPNTQNGDPFYGLDDLDDDNKAYYFARISNTERIEDPERTLVSLNNKEEISNPPLQNTTSPGTGTSHGTVNQPPTNFLAGYQPGIVDLLSTSSPRSPRREDRWFLEKPWEYLVGELGTSGSQPTQSPESVTGDISNPDSNLQGVTTLNSQFSENIYATMGQEVAPLDPQNIILDALRAVVVLPVRAYLHGHNAPGVSTTTESSGEYTTKLNEWPKPAESSEADYKNNWAILFKEEYDEVQNTFINISLNGIYDELSSGNLIVLKWNDTGPKSALFELSQIDILSTSLFNVPATVSCLKLKKIIGDKWNPTEMSIIRSTTVYTGGEFIHNPVPYRILAEEPLNKRVGKIIHIVKNGEDLSSISTDYQLAEEWIIKANKLDENVALVSGTELVIPFQKLELDGVYDGLKPGRWLAINGMRADIPVIGREVALIQSVVHDYQQVEIGGQKNDLPGDIRHTFVTLATSLNHPYMRDSVRISANVVPATHGETARGVPPNDNEVILGGGNAALANQKFALPLPAGKRLTYLSAPTRDGVTSTLEAYLNDVLWNPKDTFFAASPRDHIYTVKTDDDGKTWLIFGDGIEGARPPTGQENVRARYRVGIGKEGNLKAGQISLLGSRPSGVKEVINWVASTGGTDPESRDQARESVKLSTRTLDRLVGLQDYQDFALTFAGIGKARAVVKEDQSGIDVWVSGITHDSLQEDSQLIKNLTKALETHDGSDLNIDVSIAIPLLVTFEAVISISHDRLWEKVQPVIHAKLSEVFGYERRGINQALALSEIVTTIQNVAGVEHVQTTHFDAQTEYELIKKAKNDSSTSPDIQPILDNDYLGKNKEINDGGPLIDDQIARQWVVFIDPEASILIVLKEADSSQQEQSHGTA